MLPEGIEMVHPRYAISWRNDWLLKHSECVIAYVDRPWGGAAKYLEKAERQSKKLIHIKTSPNRQDGAAACQKRAVIARWA